jgi:multiple sugar transport system permease protein
MSRYVPYILVAAPFTLLVALVLIPEIYCLYLSVTDYKLGQGGMYIGASNYSYLFSSSEFWESLRITIIYIVTSLFSEFAFGLGIALLLYGISRGQRIVTSIILLPYAISEVVAAVTWRSILDPAFGLYNYLLSLFGFSMETLLWFANENLALPAIIIVNVWKNTPFTAIILYSALVSLPRDPFEAAKIDGASSIQTFRHVIMPLIAPASLIALMFRTIFLFRMFALPYNLTRGGPMGATRLLAIYLYDLGFRYWDFGLAAALAVIMLLFTLASSIYYLRMMYEKV